MNARPWINVDGADAEAIQRQIDQCPSGALSYQSPNQNDNWTMDTKTQTQTAQVSIITNGPMKVSAPVIIERDGEEKQHDKDVFLCRCGASSGKPYCDGSHKKVGFEG